MREREKEITLHILTFSIIAIKLGIYLYIEHIFYSLLLFIKGYIYYKRTCLIEYKVDYIKSLSNNLLKKITIGAIRILRTKYIGNLNFPLDFEVPSNLILFVNAFLSIENLHRLFVPSTNCINRKIHEIKMNFMTNFSSI